MCTKNWSRWMLLCIALLPACSRMEMPTPTPTQPVTATPASAITPTPTAPAAQGGDYERRAAPAVRRSKTPSAAIEVAETGNVRLTSGEYTLRFAGTSTHDALLVQRTDSSGLPVGSQGALALRPLGNQLNPLPALNDVTSETSDDVLVVTLSGDTGWAEVTLQLEVYPYQPGLLHTLLTATLHDPPPDSPALEWTFVDPATGEETKAGFTVYADPAPMCAPVLYGYAQVLDSTLFYAVDRTALNPFMQAAHYTPSATPGRRGRSFGHTIDAANLRALPAGKPFVLYDGYLYLTPGEPDGEAGMFAHYLHNLGDVYDLLHKPVNGTLPDWRALAQKTIADLADERVWVELGGKRYLRAYVGDTRQGAELISQLDVLEGIVRYEARYDDVTALDDDLWATLPDFYDQGYGMLVNSGPVALGRQTRGDTWYELGHAVKMAELGLMGHEQATQLALDSAAAWMDFAHAVDYEFPQFYDFDTWRGMGREPDCAGGYAYYMLLLHDLTASASSAQGRDTLYLDEARAAIEHLAGHGFRLAYETHVTAQAVAACARLADLTGETEYLQLSLAPLANLLHLVWLWECDYGSAGLTTGGSATGYRTFFGLSPMARSAVITPKEQYEAWLYLREYLTLAHGQIDPAIEGLVAGFLEHTLTTLPYTLPPLLPAGVATDSPTTYSTVTENALELYIPLEDLRGGWSVAGVIGQEVYGAGMAPTLAAVAYQEVAPGVVVYSGPPVVEAIGDGDAVLVTFGGVAGRPTPVQVFGVASVEGVETRTCGAGLCFQAEGGTVYRLQRR